MTSPLDIADRTGQIERVSAELLQQSALLTRLVVRQMSAGLTRSEAGLLSTLSGGPRRITELADLEGLAQPTTTLLVKRLEERGLVRRERPATDGRVVLVRLTDDGREALEDFRGRAATILRGHLEEMTDEQVAALAATTETLAELVAALQGAAAD